MQKLYMKEPAIYHLKKNDRAKIGASQQIKLLRKNKVEFGVY